MGKGTWGLPADAGTDVVVAGEGFVAAATAASAAVTRAASERHAIHSSNATSATCDADA